MSSVRRGRSGSEGQAVVELALVLPLLVLILVAIVDVGRMMNVTLTLEHAARESVRLGITGATDAQIRQRALAVSPALDPTQLTVTVSPAGTHSSGSDLTVTVSYAYKLLGLYDIFGTSVPLTGRLTARVE